MANKKQLTVIIMMILTILSPMQNAAEQETLSEEPQIEAALTEDDGLSEEERAYLEHVSSLWNAMDRQTGKIELPGNIA
ncbi:MAG: hypothetical protein OEY19_00365, partial [Gammaproteobacteria bacterium]|nr:hypothetical protein [Gammaproteobacteria bacterium]